MRAKKSYGQHFLVQRGVVEKMIDALAIQEGESIVEVGPGMGAFTGVLAARGYEDRLTLIEADAELIPMLHEKYPKANVVHGDAAQVDIAKLISAPWVFVSNLPFNSAAAILEHVFLTNPPPERAAVVVQKEQGERMRAQPGETSLLSIVVQLYAEPKKLFTIAAGSFSPPPKVDSEALLLISTERQKDEEEIIALAKAGFGSRRKQLKKNLASAGIAPIDTVARALESLGHTQTARAQELSVSDWRALKRALG